MNTLISQRVPLHNIKRSSPSPWTETSSTLHSTSTFKPLDPFLPKKPWRFQAEVKGFGRESVTVSKKGSQNNIPNNQNKSNNDDDDKIPQVVWDRMIVRILFYVGTPMATGIAFLFIFNVLKENNILDFPPWIPFLTTLLAFGTSTLGIAYGTLSTSLDPDKKGSALGWEQVQQNWPEMWREEDESKI